MSKELIADTPAGNSIISNQGSGPTNTSEQIIGRNSSDRETTKEEKKSDKPLSTWQQVDLVRKAMNTFHKRDFAQWGAHTIGTAFTPHSENGYNLVTYSRFFRDLLLFVSKPKIAAKFGKNVPDGLEMIKALSGLLLELQGLSLYEEYALYHGMSYLRREEPLDFLEQAEEYLSGNDLQAVVEGVKAEEEKQKVPKKSVVDAANTVLWFRWDSIKPIPLTVEPEEEEVSVFKNDDELLAALDRYFPKETWPASKLAIASEPKMKSKLASLEKRRMIREGESDEERKARQVDLAIEASLIMGPNSLGLTGDPQYDVNTGMKKQTPAQPAASPATTKKTSTKPAKKSATNNKKA